MRTYILGAIWATFTKMITNISRCRLSTRLKLNPTVMAWSFSQRLKVKAAVIDIIGFIATTLLRRKSLEPAVIYSSTVVLFVGAFPASNMFARERGITNRTIGRERRERVS